MKKQVRLVELLLEKSRNQELEWTETARQGTYQVSFPASSIWISHGGPSNNDIVISIINRDGQLADAFSDRDIESDDINAYTKMLELFGLARRTATGAEKALDDIISSLEKPSGRDPTR